MEEALKDMSVSGDFVKDVKLKTINNGGQVKPVPF